MIYIELLHISSAYVICDKEEFMLINNESEFSLELFCGNNIHVRENRDKSFFKKYFIFFCGADQDRTDDLLNAIQALFQLSYGP
tara:strand:+ start:3281 stop:3532 length:252 start_codon:yes stop_codon:yes gene_type:complete